MVTQNVYRIMRGSFTVVSAVATHDPSGISRSITGSVEKGLYVSHDALKVSIIKLRAMIGDCG